MLNKNCMLNPRTVEAGVYFDRNFPLETAVICFFHRSNPAWASAGSALPQYPVNVPKLGEGGAMAVITE